MLSSLHYLHARSQFRNQRYPERSPEQPQFWLWTTYFNTRIGGWTNQEPNRSLSSYRICFDWYKGCRVFIKQTLPQRLVPVLILAQPVRLLTFRVKNRSIHQSSLERNHWKLCFHWNVSCFLSRLTWWCSPGSK